MMQNSEWLKTLLSKPQMENANRLDLGISVFQLNIAWHICHNRKINKQQCAKMKTSKMDAK